MEEKLRKIMRRDFPMLYKGRFGASCGNGWFELLYCLSEKLEQELQATDKKTREFISIMQIKEKFGTLRYYTSCATGKMYDYISHAENISEVICEDCGKFGVYTRQYRGWYMTICKYCYIKMCIFKKLGNLKWRYISRPLMIFMDYFKGDKDEL